MQVVVVRREAAVGSNGLSDALFMAQNEGKSWDRAEWRKGAPVGGGAGI
jgi:hypothetical protein